MRYFSPEGDPNLYACPCGECDTKPTNILLEKIDDIRHEVGFPIVVNSGPRCPEYCKARGWSPTSEHTIGTAVDIKVNSSTERYAVITAALRLGSTRIGIANTFIHIGFSEYHPKEVVWVYK